MKVAVTGSHGLIGSALVSRLEGRGDTVVRVTRGADGLLDTSGLSGVDAVVNLAGEGVAEKRWTDAQKARILDSRVQNTERLCAALAALERPPSVLVSGSAIGFYGERGDETLTETSPSGGGFLADVCRRWEAATATAEAAGIRVAHIRTGIVLSPRGGALARQLLLFKLGVGGKLASGRQWVSWIAIDDEVGAIVHIIDTASVSGAVNLTAPNPVRNVEFTKALGKAVHRPTALAVPSFALKIVLGGELADNLLASQRVVPDKLTASGYRFTHPEIGPALDAVVAS